MSYIYSLSELKSEGIKTTHYWRKYNNFQIKRPKNVDRVSITRTTVRKVFQLLNEHLLDNTFRTLCYFMPWLWRSRLERWSSKRKVGCSNPSRDEPKSLKQAMTAPLQNARQPALVSRVLVDDYYNPMPCVTICVTH